MTTYAEQTASSITTTTPSVTLVSLTEVSADSISLTEVSVSPITTTVLNDPQSSFDSLNRNYGEGSYNTGTYGLTTNIYS